MRLQSTDLSPDMVKEIEEFGTWVLRLGEGNLPTKSLKEYDESTWIEIPEGLLIHNNGDPIHQIIESIYPDASTRIVEPNYLKDRTLQQSTPPSDIHPVPASIIPTDVVGVYIDSSDVTKIKDGKRLREIWIRDETANSVRVVLWGDLADKFVKPTNVVEKPIFVLSSTSVDYYKVTQKYSVNSRDSSSYYFDLDIPEEKDDDSLQANPQAYDDGDDDDDGIQLKLMRKQVTQKNKRLQNAKEGDKVTPAKKSNTRKN
ncbi:hypothetical protein FRX31_026365 [Thalictrum thalictroides]|uniref:Replication protein A OB domain-containing protein n=1 Tax=Thalictrum thalictroides TaxID=46969 RepID=A0A7J6VIK1_THATH|nr:hypothetical protein FRX31_026365 [Thalictrum thalictroides]